MWIGRNSSPVNIATIAAVIEILFVTINQNDFLCSSHLQLAVRHFRGNKALASIPISCIE
jgi:hypothetical protein